jgi:hypothetical protein
LRLILGVENEARAGNAVEVDRIENVSIEAGVAFVGSHTGFTLCHIAVGAVESLGGFIVNNVLIFPALVVAVGLLRRIKPSEWMG